jgi:hypothetical protein
MQIINLIILLECVDYSCDIELEFKTIKHGEKNSNPTSERVIT